MADKVERKTYALIARKGTEAPAEELRSLGNRVLEFPLSLAPCLDQADGLPDPGNFDWIAFLDIFSAGYFFEAAARAGRGAADTDAVQICAAGDATADHLRSLRAHTDVVSRSPEDLLAALSEYVGDNGPVGEKFLIPGRRGTSCQLSAGLAVAGALVTEAPVYELI